MAVSGHSTVDDTSDCFTFKTGYSPVGGNTPAVKERFRTALFDTPEPKWNDDYRNLQL